MDTVGGRLADCSFQIRVNDTDAAGETGDSFSSAGGGTANIVIPSSYTMGDTSGPASVSAIFEGLAAGDHTLSIHVRGIGASECWMNPGGFNQIMWVEEILPVSTAS